MSIKELQEKLGAKKGNILTTKAILEKGISRYYINKLVENKILEKKERGKYLVLTSLKDKKKCKRYSDFQIEQFKYQVRQYNFNKSYDYLIKFYNLQTTKHSYEYIYVSLVLLRQLLKERKDFSLLNDFDKDICKSYLSYLSPFKISILEENYDQALIDLDNIKKDGHSLNVDVLLILVNTVMRINKIQAKETINDLRDLDFYYGHFKKQLRNGNLESAKDLLKRCIDLDTLEHIPYKNELFILVEGLTNLKENKIDFNEDKGIVYEGNHEQVLIQAIQNKDFKVAFSKIGACTYQTTNTSYLLMKDILYKMSNLRKKEKKIETKESVKASLILSLYSCVMNEEFNEAKELLNNSSENGRLKDYCLILFQELNCVQNKYKYYNTVILDNDDLFKQVFEAIRRRDLYQARELLSKVISLAKDKKEFQIYLKLIDKILYQNQITKEKQDGDRNLSPFFNNGMYLSIDAILRVKALLEERIELFGENKRDYHLLNIIEVIITASEIPISKNDFSSLPSDKEKPLDRLNDYLQNGEFVLAEELIDKTPDWKVFAEEYSIFDIKMIKYLLKTLKVSLYQYNEKERETTDLPYMSANFYSLIKRRKYKEAFQFYLKHEDILYETENKDIIKNLIFLFYMQSEEGIRLYEEYLNAKEQSNRDLERIALLNYKQYLKINNIDDNYVPVLKNK